MAAKQTVAVGYCRVSTEGQAVDGVSLAAQQAKIVAWCEVNGYTLLGVFTDAGISGSRADNRPQLQAALDAACKSKAVLVTYALSRLARNTRDTIEIAARLERAGADLASVSERIDTSSAAGAMVFQMLAVLSEFERRQVGERTKVALAYKKSRGERTGGVPYGFTLAADGVALVEDAAEQAVLATIAELRAAGVSMRGIADELNSRGVATKNGGLWKHSSVQRILERKAA
jgi:site-specific DNA recombinase